MSKHRISSPTDAVSEIASFFGYSTECEIQVSEEKAFGGAFVKLGTIRLIANGKDFNETKTAVKMGRYEWAVPDGASVEKELLKVMEINKPDDTAAQTIKTQY